MKTNSSKASTWQFTRSSRVRPSTRTAMYSRRRPNRRRFGWTGLNFLIRFRCNNTTTAATVINQIAWKRTAAAGCFCRLVGRMSTLKKKTNNGRFLVKRTYHLEQSLAELNYWKPRYKSWNVCSIVKRRRQVARTLDYEKWNSFCLLLNIYIYIYLLPLYIIYLMVHIW